MATKTVEQLEAEAILAEANGEVMETTKYQVAERPLAEIIADLSRELPTHLLSKKTIRNTDIIYISWHRAVQIFDHVAPGWEYEIKQIVPASDRLIITVRLWIHAKDGDFFREATGTELFEESGYGDVASNAESMALRRAMAKFGLGLYLYDFERRPTGDNIPNPSLGVGGGTSYSQPSGGSHQQPYSSNAPLSGGITDKQLHTLLNITTRNNLSEEIWAKDYSRNRVTRFEEMTKEEASQCIDAMFKQVK